MYYDTIAALCFLFMLSLIGLTWWAVYIYVQPSPPKARRLVPQRYFYIEPPESTEQTLLKGVSTLLILEILFGHRDH